MASASVLVSSLVFVSIVALTIMVAVWMAWRAGRRRLRALRRHTAVRSAASLWAVARPGAMASGRVAGTLSTARIRHALWRNVGSAERSVRQASAAGAAVGNLPSLCRRLHDVTLDLDRVLAIGDGLAPDLPELGDARRQASEVLRASTAIRAAALAAAGDAALTRVRALADDADREVRSLAAGVARARAAFPPVA